MAMDSADHMTAMGWHSLAQQQGSAVGHGVDFFVEGSM